MDGKGVDLLKALLANLSRINCSSLGMFLVAAGKGKW